jgi:hypothetical protein
MSHFNKEIMQLHNNHNQDFTQLKAHNIIFFKRENTGKNIRISAKESVGYSEFKQHKPWFNEDFKIIR